MTFTAKSTIAIIPPPPRFTGDNPEADNRAMIEWINQFYQSSVVESGLLDPAYQASGSNDINLDDLPAPEGTTIARAQAVANIAYQRVRTGQFTVSELETAAQVQFDTDFGTEDYAFAASVVAFTGSPAAGAYSTAAVVKGTGGIAVTLAQAPGASASVTFDFIIVK